MWLFFRGVFGRKSCEFSKVSFAVRVFHVCSVMGGGVACSCCVVCFRFFVWRNRFCVWVIFEGSF